MPWPRTDIAKPHNMTDMPAFIDRHVDFYVDKIGTPKLGGTDVFC